jgi:hypothetical protein
MTSKAGAHIPSATRQSQTEATSPLRARPAKPPRMVAAIYQARDWRRVSAVAEAATKVMRAVKRAGRQRPIKRRRASISHQVSASASPSWHRANSRAAPANMGRAGTETSR